MAAGALSCHVVALEAGSVSSVQLKGHRAAVRLGCVGLTDPGRFTDAH